MAAAHHQAIPAAVGAQHAAPFPPRARPWPRTAAMGSALLRSTSRAPWPAQHYSWSASTIALCGTGRAWQCLRFPKGLDSVVPEDFLPEDRFNFKKQKQLIKLSQIWLLEHRIPLDSKWQIDVIGISIDINSKKAKIRHFKNAVEDIS